MKRRTFILLCILVSGVTSHSQVDSSFHLYLLIGQSNMAGRGAIDSLSKVGDNRILMLNKNNEWVLATDPVHFDKPVAGVGPAISFAKAMLQEAPGVKIGLIPGAWGGSSIKVWSPDSVYLGARPYNDAVNRTSFAMHKGVLKGVLWHQGESDNTPEGVLYYMDSLKLLVDRLRERFSNSRLPFVAGEIGYFCNSTRINPVINAIPGQVPFTAVVSAEGLTDKGDQIHFDTRSARELGKRYAEAMKRLLSE